MHPVVVFIMCCLIFAISLDKTGLTKRLGYFNIKKAGNSVAKFTFIIAISLGLASAFMHNAAACAIGIVTMLPLMRAANIEPHSNTAKFMMLSLPFACSSGGMGTLVGGGRNMVDAAFAKEKIEAFTQATGIKVDVETAASGSCTYRLITGSCDIASSARKLYRRHAVYGYTETAFCKDPIAVIARTECGVKGLSQEELQDIFAGDIKNWKEVGGADLPILVIVLGTKTAAHKNFPAKIIRW
jgi:ABC-type phosphate transport system substrate-binding protein